MQVVDAFISDYKQPIGAFTLLSAADQQKLLVDFNNTDAPYPKDKTVIQLFEAQVQRTPQATVIKQSKNAVTYAQLNERANQLAHYLRTQGIGPETAVAICMDRSVDVLIAIWGVLKAGGGYIPIDPAYPLERITFMLADAQPKIVLTNNEMIQWEMASAPEVKIVNPATLNLTDNLGTNPTPLAAGDNLAYMIYTSGSTGKPKGTMITHRGLMNYIWWARETYQAGEMLDFPLYSSLAFDLTVTSIFVPLLSGGKIVVYSESD